MKASIFLMVAAVLAISCSQAPSLPRGTEIKTDGGPYHNVSVSELKAMMGKKDFLLVNVHIPHQDDIPATDLALPYNEIEQNVSKLPQDKGAKIALYCRSGPMSTEAAAKLVKLGYVNIWNLNGGMIEWNR